MDHIAYHLEALRRQRAIERRHDALERLLAAKLESDRQKQARYQNDTDEQKIMNGTRSGTRNGTQTADSRGSVRLPPLNRMPATGSTYYKGRYKDLYNMLVPPRQEALHIWRDLAFNVRHDRNLVAKPYRNVDVVKR